MLSYSQNLFSKTYIFPQYSFRHLQVAIPLAIKALKTIQQDKGKNTT